MGIHAVFCRRNSTCCARYFGRGNVFAARYVGHADCLLYRLAVLALGVEAAIQTVHRTISDKKVVGACHADVAGIGVSRRCFYA